LRRLAGPREAPIGARRPGGSARRLSLVARAFERIGDNAVDIGAHLNFAVTGTFEARDAA
jgi:phosphate uptake regulator